MVLAGLLPLVLVVVGTLESLERGYMTSRSGEPIGALVGVATYAVVFAGGAFLTGRGVWYLLGRKEEAHSRSGEERCDRCI